MKGVREGVKGVGGKNGGIEGMKEDVCLLPNCPFVLLAVSLTTREVKWSASNRSRKGGWGKVSAKGTGNQVPHPHHTHTHTHTHTHRDTTRRHTHTQTDTHTHTTQTHKPYTDTPHRQADTSGILDTCTTHTQYQCVKST